MIIERELFKIEFILLATEHVIWKNQKEEVLGINVNDVNYKNDNGKSKEGYTLPYYLYKKVRDVTMEKMILAIKAHVRRGYEVWVKEIEPFYKVYNHHNNEFLDYQMIRKYNYGYHSYNDKEEMSVGTYCISYSTCYPELENIVFKLMSLIDIIKNDPEAKVNIYSDDLVITG